MPATKRKTSIFDQPHTLDPAEIEGFLKTFEQEVAASARFRPNDKERKRLLVRIGGFEVRTVPIWEPGKPKPEPTTHYNGPDLAEAIRVYNELR